MTVHLKQDEPDTSNRLDGRKQGVIGQPISRVEGLAKVTGTAPYAAEYPIEGCAEGVKGEEGTEEGGGQEIRCGLALAACANL